MCFVLSAAVSLRSSILRLVLHLYLIAALRERRSPFDRRLGLWANNERRRCDRSVIMNTSRLVVCGYALNAAAGILNLRTLGHRCAVRVMGS